MAEITVTVQEARAYLADHVDRAAAGVPTVITRDAEAVLVEGGPPVTMAELLADPFAEPGRPPGP
ncbi:hypothetical protein ACIQUV_21460 [Streptomyces globosus]|jgi:hypothetical protein|uniref:hypothetical protein n=1 Tax=Streptomyces globosus TaxID=68209 RepID=UPI0037FB5D2C